MVFFSFRLRRRNPCIDQFSPLTTSVRSNQSRVLEHFYLSPPPFASKSLPLVQLFLLFSCFRFGRLTSLCFDVLSPQILSLILPLIPKSRRSQYQSLLKSSEASLSLFKKLSKEMHANISHSDLLSSSHHHQFATSDDPYANDRTRLLAGTATLEDGSM